MTYNIDYSLYLVTDRELMRTRTLEETVEKALCGGCTMVQLREKTCTSQDFYQTALRIKQLTDQYRVPLIINDRVDIALAVQAAGVHVGQGDLPAQRVRHLIGDGMLLGVSVSTEDEARKAANDGADYIGVGAMFPTDTKTNTRPVSIDGLLRIRKAVTIPIVVIGGINKNNVHCFSGSGINGLAVVSAVIAQPDVQFAAKELLDLFQSIAPIAAD